jgi:hypothetical protein
MLGGHELILTALPMNFNLLIQTEGVPLKLLKFP